MNPDYVNDFVQDVSDVFKLLLPADIFQYAVELLYEKATGYKLTYSYEAEGYRSQPGTDILFAGGESRIILEPFDGIQLTFHKNIHLCAISINGDDYTLDMGSKKDGTPDNSYFAKYIERNRGETSDGYQTAKEDLVMMITKINQAENLFTF